MVLAGETRFNARHLTADRRTHRVPGNERQQAVSRTSEIGDIPRVTVILAPHHEFKRLGLERLCDAAGFASVSIRLSDAAALPPPTGEPQVLITDLPAVDDPAIAATLAAFRRDGGQVLLTVGANEQEITQATKLDCDGYLDEDSLDAETLADAIRQLQHGQVPMPARMVQVLFSRVNERPTAESTPPPLTERETKVVELLAAGYSNKQIARRIGASAHATKRAVASIMAKLNCPNRTMVVARALRDGLCPPSAVAR